MLVPESKNKRRNREIVNLQNVVNTIGIDIYNDPHGSVVRELFCNASDSCVEKEQAVKILKDEAKVEDYYKIDNNKDGDFNPDYYDLNHLNDSNIITLKYEEGQDTDVFSVLDTGVGLGDDRLFNYFKIGYSSKKNNAQQVGSYGYGNKSFAALYPEYCDVETVHNGRLFKIRQTLDYYESLIPKVNSKTKQFNPYIEQDGEKIYYLPSESKNYTKISIHISNEDRLKGRKNLFIKGAKQQLLYNTSDLFEDFNFLYVYENDTVENIPIKAEIIYRDDNLIVSDNNVYAKPHIITKVGQALVCYGHMQFDQLEYPDIYANVGVITEVYIKGVQDGVKPDSSRESIIYDKNTKHYLEKKFKKTSESVANILSDKLDSIEDYFEWCVTVDRLTTSRSYNYDSKDPLSIISKMTDISNMEFIHKKTGLDNKLLFKVLFSHNIEVNKVYIKSNTIKRSEDAIGYNDAKDLIDNKLFYLYFKPKDYRHNNKIDKYLANYKHDNWFFTIQDDTKIDKNVYNQYKHILKTDVLKDIFFIKDKVQDYTKVEVPDHLEINDNKTVESKKQSSADGFIISTANSYDWKFNQSAYRTEKEWRSWVNLHHSVANYKIYGNQTDYNSLLLLHFLFRSDNSYFNKCETSIIKIAKDKNNLFEDLGYRHVNDIMKEDVISDKLKTMNFFIVYREEIRTILKGVFNKSYGTIVYDNRRNIYIKELEPEYSEELEYFTALVKNNILSAILNDFIKEYIKTVRNNPEKWCNKDDVNRLERLKRLLEQPYIKYVNSIDYTRSDIDDNLDFFKKTISQIKSNR